MGTNFSFLKKVDKDLFEIIETAEKLYRDEYFEQCMTQTRRFGENVCKKVLGNKRTLESSFDDMLATLKDHVSGMQEKEFVEDLYFLKKHGNKSTHAVKVQHDGMEALECLQRAFEAAISYCVYSKGTSKNLLKLRYDTELLITGQKSKKTLAEKYKEKKELEICPPCGGNVRRTKGGKYNKSKCHETKTIKPQFSQTKSKKPKSGISGFWIFVGISFVISLLIILAIFLVTL